MSRATAVTLACAAAALAVALTLEAWLPLDEAAFLWIQHRRTCAIDEGVRWIDAGVRGALGVVIALAVLGGARDRRTLLTYGAVFLAGAFAGEVLKTALERLRPNSTPGMTTGNSFPSGHTMNTAMAAAIAVRLLWRSRWPRAVVWALVAVAVGCAAAQGMARMFQGSHWASDVAGSLFLGVGVVAAAGTLRRLSATAVASAAAALVLAFVAFDHAPGLRIHLPSLLDSPSHLVASLDFGSPSARRSASGAWADGPGEAIGAVSWAMSPEVGVTVPGDGEPGRMLKLVLRPPSGYRNERHCARVRVTVNGWSAPSFALRRGWREYRVLPPEGVLRKGPNRVVFRIDGATFDADGHPDRGLAAFHSVRLAARS